jgi:hypothetical protein
VKVASSYLHVTPSDHHFGVMEFACQVLLINVIFQLRTELFEVYYILGVMPCSLVKVVFWRNVLSVSSGLKSKRNKEML